MFVVFALLGLRRSEVLGLMWSDVDLEAGTLQIRRGLQRVGGKLVTSEPKTRRSRRTHQGGQPLS
jgi:integrase